MVPTLLKEDEDPPKSDFVTNNIYKLFTALNLLRNFLKNHPSTWESDKIISNASNWKIDSLTQTNLS